MGGKYRFEVGFRDEPALVDQFNAVLAQVSVPAEQGRLVEGLEKTLRVEVVVGGNARAMSLELQPVEGQPGTHAGAFIPTRTGSYIFHFSGSIQRLPIDERFESGPGRFNDVQSAEALQFPDKVPSGGAALAEMRSLRVEAEQARTLAVAGVAVGTLGLVVAALSLFWRRPSAKVSGLP